MTNQGDAAGESVVTSFFEEDPTLQYGRRIWVPANSRRTSWYPVLPPGTALPATERYDLKSLQFDGSAQGEVTVKRSDGQLLTSTWLSAKYRGYVTGMIDDVDAEGESDQFELAIAIRMAHGMSRDISTFHDGFLPAIPAAFEGMDQLFICSDRPADDTAALAALRSWLLDGGRLWIMLDCVSPETASLLAEGAFDCQVVDRVGLTEFEIESVGTGDSPSSIREFEEPVDFVRVFVNSGQVTHTVNGWPAAFWHPVGRGRIIYTTLGARGWLRPRDSNAQGNSQSEVKAIQDNQPPSDYVAIGELASLGSLFLSPPDPLPVKTEQLHPVLTQQIGYEIVSRNTLLALLSLFCLGLLVAGLILIKRKRLEFLGWLGPTLAVCIAATIIVLGSRSRQAVPNTLAELQIVESSSFSESLNVQGVAAIFNRDSSDAVIGATSEGFFMPDSAGLAGRVRRMIWTDIDKWHFENLELPAGVRFAPFKVPFRSKSPVVVRASFGPQGLRGHVAMGSFEHISDAVITTQSGQTAAIRFDDVSKSDEFSLGSSEVLPPGEFISSALLSDQQRRRQDIYRQLVPGPNEKPFPNVPTFMAWAPPLELGFDFPDQDKQIGSALVLAPVVLDRSPPGTDVLIPSPFLPYRMDPSRGPSLAFSNTTRQWLARKPGARTWLRVQFPDSVLPMHVADVTVTLHINGPANKLELVGVIDGKTAVIATRDDPVGTLTVTLDRQEAIQLDADGGLLLGVFVAGVEEDASASSEFKGGTNKWKIEYLHLDARGKTLPSDSIPSRNDP